MFIFKLPHSKRFIKYITSIKTVFVCIFAFDKNYLFSVSVFNLVELHNFIISKNESFKMYLGAVLQSYIFSSEVPLISDENQHWRLLVPLLCSSFFRHFPKS